MPRTKEPVELAVIECLRNGDKYQVLNICKSFGLTDYQRAYVYNLMQGLI